MRKFRGQKISKEKDFFTHDLNFDHLSPSSNTFQVTLGDIPKNELLATAASIHDDTFVKLGLRNHTLRRPITSRRVVSCTPEIQQTTTTAKQYTTLLPPAVPKRASRLKNSFQASDNQRSKQKVISMFERPTIDEEGWTVPQRVHTHKNKLSLEHDFNISGTQYGHKSSDSLILEIIEKYSEICYLNIDAVPEWIEDEQVPELVNCLSVSNSSIDTSSQFSFEQELDDNELIRRNLSNSSPPRTKPINNKPLPPIPVKKLSQSSYRNYDLKRDKTISLDPILLQSKSTRVVTPPAKENPYILTRTGGDSFKSERPIEPVRQDEDDVAKFTRKCSTSSSRYSTSSEEHFTAPSTPNSSTFHLEDESFDMQTAPSSPQSSFYIKNPFSPKIYKRNLTPINEKNGYEENKTTLCVVND